MDDSLEASRWQRATAAMAAVCVASLLCAAVLTLFDDAAFAPWRAAATTGVAHRAVTACDPASTANARQACAQAAITPGRPRVALAATGGG